MGAKLNLAAIPPPDIVKELDYDKNLARIISTLKEVIPGWKGAPSDPLFKAAEVFSYEQFLIQARTNESIKQMLIAYSQGTNLDNLGALLGIVRTRIELDDGVVVVESDASFRESIISAPDGSSTAGTESSYEFHIRRICSQIDSDPNATTKIRLADVNVYSPEKTEDNRQGKINIVILFSDQPSGQVTEEIADKRFELLHARMIEEKLIPLNDRPLFMQATIVKKFFKAELFLKKGPDAGPFKASAKERVTALFQENFKIGREIGISSIFSALHVNGVTKVEIKDVTPPPETQPGEGETLPPDNPPAVDRLFVENLTPQENEAIYAVMEEVTSNDSAR